MARKKSWYAVKKGKNTGLFTTWDECRAAVEGVPGAVFKGFYTKEEAEAYLGRTPSAGKEPLAPALSPGKKGTPPDSAAHRAAESVRSGEPAHLKREPPVAPDEMTVYVDGSYAPFLPRRYAFGAVFLYKGKTETFCQCFEDGENAKMRNVAGEIAGARFAMETCLSRGISRMVLYYDYAGIENWCTGAWQANKKGTKALRDYYASVKDRLHVEFCKVKSHTGVTYNEMADRLAKEALFHKKPLLP